MKKMTNDENTHMTDKDVKEINDLLDNWKILNSDWKKMNGLPQALNMWAKRSVTPVNRKSALTSLKLIWKSASSAVEYREEGRTDADDIKSGYLNTKGEGWRSPFSSRATSTVDADTETVISSIISARANMATLIDGISNGDDILDIYEAPVGDIPKETKEKMSNIELLAFAQQHALEEVEEVLEAWAKTLVLETLPLSSINPNQHNLSFKTTFDILSQNATVSKLRQYRRAFDEKFDSKYINKDKKEVLIARHKVKWSGKLEDAPVINYTPLPRQKNGDEEK